MPHQFCANDGSDSGIGLLCKFVPTLATMYFLSALFWGMHMRFFATEVDLHAKDGSSLGTALLC